MMRRRLGALGNSYATPRTRAPKCCAERRQRFVASAKSSARLAR